MEVQSDASDVELSAESGSHGHAQGVPCVRMPCKQKVSVLLAGILLMAAAVIGSHSVGLWPRSEMLAEPESLFEKGGKAAAGNSSGAAPCLCAFDIDRTLTCKQGWHDVCPGSSVVEGAQDTAFQGGTLTLSDLAQNIGSSFCGKCYRGIVTAGAGDGKGERAKMLEMLGGTEKTKSDVWQDVQKKPEMEVTSSLVFASVNGKKQDSLRSMVLWFKSSHGVEIKDEDVYFFDDLAENVKGFKGSTFNARQVSCDSRGPKEQWVDFAGQVGGCGGRVYELRKERGVHLCEGKKSA